MNIDAKESILQAFRTLVNSSWPDAADDDTWNRVLAAARGAQTEAAFRAAMQDVIEVVKRQHPDVHIWWKNEKSQFMGGCEAFIKLANVGEAHLFSGINDMDPRLPWSRQGAHYVRDDREVFESNTAKLNILERQDQEDGTVWLKTSKVPFVLPKGGGGTVGGFEVITDADAQKLAQTKKRD